MRANRVLVAILAAAAACGGQRATPRAPDAATMVAASSDSDDSGDSHEQDSGQSSLAARQIAIMRALIADTTGSEQLELRARLFYLLAASAEPSVSSQARGVAIALVAEPEFSTLAQAADVLADVAATYEHRDADLATAMWQRLLRDYAGSERAADGYFVFGERAFDVGDLAAAQDWYQRVLTVPRSRQLDIARYKLAWVDYNLGRGAEALAGFVTVARSTGDPIRKAALSDAVRVYADVGSAEKAYQFFVALDPDRAAELTVQLGADYRDRGKLAEAAIVNAAVAQASDGEPACRANLATATALMFDRDDAITALVQITPAPSNQPCTAEAAQFAADVATAWTTELQATRGDPRTAIAMWQVARTLAAAGPSRRRAAIAVAHLTWQRAAFAATAPDWLAAAEAFAQADSAGVGDSADTARTALINAIAIDPSIVKLASAVLLQLQQ